jgi:hypothetical protein
VFPNETAVVVKADLPLLGSLAGILVGLPDSAVKEHLAATPMEELLRDAVYELLHIASAVITTEGRGGLPQDGDRSPIRGWRGRENVQQAGPPELFQCSGGWLPGR